MNYSEIRDNYHEHNRPQLAVTKDSTRHHSRQFAFQEPFTSGTALKVETTQKLARYHPLRRIHPRRVSTGHETNRIHEDQAINPAMKKAPGAHSRATFEPTSSNIESVTSNQLYHQSSSTFINLQPHNHRAMALSGRHGVETPSHNSVGFPMILLVMNFRLVVSSPL